jgi:hypothetical protein
MRFISSALIGSLFLHAAIGANAGDDVRAWHDSRNYESAMAGLAQKAIRAQLPSEKMIAQCVPAFKRTIGPFTEYSYSWIPGYHGLTIVCKDEILLSATEWSCTYVRVRFDEMTPPDKLHYQKLRQKYADLGSERMIGRWGWERPRMRDSQ